MNIITKGTIATFTLLASAPTLAEDIHNPQWLKQQLNSDIQLVVQQIKAELPKNQIVTSSKVTLATEQKTLVARQSESKTSERRRSLAE